MTRKEAIRLYKLQLVYIGRLNRPVNESVVEMTKLALAALQDQEERENPERLTIEQLKGMNCPVWLSYDKPTADKNGYWCLCHNGMIILPSGRCYEAEEIPHWDFYRYERKEI